MKKSLDDRLVQLSEVFLLHYLTIAKKQLIYSVYRSRQATNNNKIKCRVHGRVESVIYVKCNSHKLYILSEFHRVRFLTKIASQVAKFISMKFNVVLQKLIAKCLYYII